MSPGDAANLRPAEQPLPKAPVTPRARRGDGFARLPLDRLILPLVDPPRPVLIGLVAPPGGGKTMALRFLRGALSPHPHVRLFDEDQQIEAREAAQSGPAIFACQCPTSIATETFELCPWTLDDCMEYLASQHRPQVASVLDRLANDPSLDALKGSPDLLCYVMDQMVADPSLPTARQTLREFLVSLALPRPLQAEFAALCFQRLGITTALPRPTPGQLLKLESLRWFRHEAVQRVFLGQFIADGLARGEMATCMGNMVCRTILPDIAIAVAEQPSAVEMLERFISTQPRHSAVAMAASILLRVNPAWRPAGLIALNLTGASLRGAQWSGIELRGACLIGADFTDANLCNANLKKLIAVKGQFDGANLRGALLVSAKMHESTFVGADLSNVVADAAILWKSDFTDAILTGADLSGAHLDESTFKDATLHQTKLRGALLRGLFVAGATFIGADFSRAMLTRIAMCDATWEAVTFARADVRGCNLEGLEIRGADFTLADLTGSLLTGSRMPGGNFCAARLVEAGLAEIDWPNANLRDANLTHASFHLGSSRSGLVGSTIPCEGSRTGFYTDHYNEQDYKSPEEIRKACLCGADLRGARLEGTDFYLVDLRDAKYTQDQQEHFARCGAILKSRVG